ncbi:MAG: AAA family ATPase [Candidatus Diapherotrites archaeon]|nr:AAA family ATPase [Candidatus Diapherotrites archaeon]
MLIVITGTPGTGKTKIAEIVAKKFQMKLVNDRKFAQQNKCGKLDKKTKELEVDLGKFRKKIQEFVKTNPNAVLEGHLFCEFPIKVRLVFVLTCNTRILEKRLRTRNYSDVKVLDNVFCEEEGYCLKKARKNYKKVHKLENNKTFKHLQNNIIKIIKKFND